MARVKKIESRFNLNKVKVIEEKLGRQSALGIAFPDHRQIEIDPRQDSKEYLDTLIHELIHCILPDMEEKDVARMAKMISKHVWDAEFRKIEK